MPSSYKTRASIAKHKQPLEQSLLLQSRNPQLILTHDIVRDTKTLHIQLIPKQPPSPESEFAKTMRGYFGIMGSTDCSCNLNGAGEKVHFENKHCLWTPPRTDSPKEEPLWHLRVSILKDQEVRGDAPSKRFAFKSMHHLTHAANQLEAAFRDSFEMKKCGVETPNAMGDRVNDGRSENVTIEFDSDSSSESWSDFLARLKVLEDEWDHEGHKEPTPTSVL